MVCRHKYVSNAVINWNRTTSIGKRSLDCSLGVIPFSHFRNQLILKQEQLQEMLNEASTEIADVTEELQQQHGDFATDIVEEDNIIEEYVDDDSEVYEPEQLFDVSVEPADDADMTEEISPRYRQLEDKREDIIKLIDKIEKRNELLLEQFKPKAKIKGEKSAKRKQSKSYGVVPVERNEELKYKKQTPLLVMQPARRADSSNSIKGNGVVIFSSAHKCDVCDQRFPTDFRLKRHVQLNHPIATPLACCNQIFDYLREYQKHQRSAHPRSIVCAYCGKILKSSKTYLVHKRTHQDVSQRKFKCTYPDCNKAFNFKIHLENHERCHSGDKPFHCNRCTASFRQAYQLTLHNRRHDGIVNNQCPMCRTTFKSKKQLENHEKECDLRAAMAIYDESQESSSLKNDDNLSDDRGSSDELWELQ